MSDPKLVAQFAGYSLYRIVLAFGSLLGTAIAAVNLSYTYDDNIDATPDWTKATSVAGFNDPVIGGLLAATLLTTLYWVYTLQKTSSNTGNVLSKEDAQKLVSPLFIIDALLITLAIYGIVAGAVSVSDHGALSKEMIGAHATAGEMVGYFGGYAVLLTMAACALYLMKKKLALHVGENEKGNPKSTSFFSEFFSDVKESMESAQKRVQHYIGAMRRK